MPNGRIHTIVTLAVTTIAAPTAALLIGDAMVGLAVFGGGLVGVLVGPDLDVDKGNISLAIIRKRSRGLAIAWRIFWWPYGQLFTHRGVSHTPIVGTLTRLIYFFPMWPVWWYAWPATLWVWVGMALADIGHWALDKLDAACGGRL